MANNESVMAICHNFLTFLIIGEKMPVQMIELEEVQIVEVSDSNLEALGITADAGYGYSISDCAS
ncbi:hypothetical protein [Polynucleobacter arcticus]|uniref:hypothetical protein n=1 Tax=Polynucleobacter arcticus TaxID=1743165 RepID=UPI0039EF90BB